MAYDDDEIAEAGDIHEYNGRTYSVVGDTVYVKGFFGWKIVEDEDEEAEGGDHRNVNSSTYSVVGNTVYRKNWLGGWDEVDNDDERAEAGDLSERNGTEYSRVGDVVYRKSLFGGWKEVDNDEDEAEAGDYRTVDGRDYSIVGNTVYRKGFFGGWEEVDDENERAEAGDKYEKNGFEYSRVGNTVYKKGFFFGGWEELTGSEKEEEIEEDVNSVSEYGSSYDSTDSDYSDYSTSYTSPVQSSSGGFSVGVILIVLISVIAIGWYTCSRSGNAGSAKTSNTYYTPATYHSAPANNSGQPTQQTSSANPYGEGNGRVSFYNNCLWCDDIQVYFEDKAIGAIKDVPLTEPTCSGQGTIFVNVLTGNKLFIFKDEHQQMWKQYINVIEEECTLIEVTRPEIEDKDDDGIYDHFTTINDSDDSGLVKSADGGHWIVCPQCHGEQEIEVMGYCKVCTRIGLGGTANSGYVTCPVCDGHGVVNGETCMNCKQTGLVECPKCMGKGRAPIKITCNLCSGKGKIRT